MQQMALVVVAPAAVSVVCTSAVHPAGHLPGLKWGPRQATRSNSDGWQEYQAGSYSSLYASMTDVVVTPEKETYALSNRVEQ